MGGSVSRLHHQQRGEGRHQLAELADELASQPLPHRLWAPCRAARTTHPHLALDCRHSLFYFHASLIRKSNTTFGHLTKRIVFRRE